jgi:hypothetical protein
MSSRWLPLWTGILPIIAIHATYLVAATEGYVPWCFPYIDSCSSISATGRNGTAFYLFKATMIPSAVLLYLFWRRSSQLLEGLGDAGRPARAILWTGSIAAIFLVVYTVALGLAGDFFYLQRRIGIILYFSMTAFSELLLTWRLGMLDLKDASRPYHLGICLGFLLIGFFTLILDALIENYVDYEDAFEWVLALLMHCYFLVMFFTWSNLIKKAPE